MIEKDIRTFLLASTNVTDIVESRIYAGRAPQGVRGALIVLRNISTNRFYTLTAEAGIVQQTLQIDCYDSTARRAQELSEKVRNRLSGYRGAAGDITVQEAIIVGERELSEPPQNKSDQWIHRYSVDYQIMFNVSVPTNV